ncbi:MAG: monovalent cation/H+ antiporter subunit E [Halodesulfurarchaeum sp.]|nr:monovalent cation/H+ antiporter subunit E [Halodesulfurarchaeum sp.]
MPAAGTDILVPVNDSETFRNTVTYAVREAQDIAENEGTKPTVYFVYPIRWRPIKGVDVLPGDSTDLFERIHLWAREDLDEEALSDGELPIEIVTDLIGRDRYLFSPADYASVIREYAHDHDIERVVLDPEYHPGGTAPLMEPILAALELTGLTVEEAPVERVTVRTPVSSRATLAKAGLVFGVSYAFYLILGGTLTSFNLLTGALVAGLSTAVFAGITAEHRPVFTSLFARVARLLVYFPYLLWEIAKANLSVAYIILHPSLPIDPEMRQFEAAVWGEYSVTTLANSITLTPGTLTVDVRRDSLYIHTLTQDARDGLDDGALERAVRFVFFGRNAMDIPTPLERNAVLAPETATVRRRLRDELTRFSADGEIRVPERPEGWDEE